jgi:hypothetical protein
MVLPDRDERRLCWRWRWRVEQGAAQNAGDAAEALERRAPPQGQAALRPTAPW